MKCRAAFDRKRGCEVIEIRRASFPLSQNSEVGECLVLDRRRPGRLMVAVREKDGWKREIRSRIRITIRTDG